MKTSLLLILLAGAFALLTGCASNPESSTSGTGDAASRNADHFASDIPQSRSRYRGLVP